MTKSIPLQEAQEIILAQCCTQAKLHGRQEEHVGLGACLGRYPAHPLIALNELPGFDQSLRDGYALAKPIDTEGLNRFYTVVDEVPAGDTRELHMAPGQAVRIMTGGLVPHNAVQVVPKEHCQETAAGVVVEDSFLKTKKGFIHSAGSDVKQGQLLAPMGQVITPEEQILLAGVGYETLPLVNRPHLSFFCTGSELLSASEEKLPGQKFSANSHLLQGLIQRCGAILVAQETVVDDPDQVAGLLKYLCKSDPDIVVSTGGMGPGKYDLVEAAFRDLGGEVLYNGLCLRPGKFTLFGTLGKTLFFGLPGPPPAVNLLFAELVVPAILALQGDMAPFPRSIEACLTEDLVLPKRGLARFRRSCLQYDGGRCLVRPARRDEVANCNIFCPASAEGLLRGDLVQVHLYHSF